MESSKKRCSLLHVAITAVLLTFFSVPLSFVAYAGAGGLVGGLLIIGALILLQLPAFLLLHCLNILPAQTTNETRTCTSPQVAFPSHPQPNVPAE